MASVRYISGRSADDNPAGGTRQSFAAPFCPIPPSVQGTFVPVKNEQVMHIYKMHHVMAHLTTESGNTVIGQNVSDWLHHVVGRYCFVTFVNYVPHAIPFIVVR